MNRIIIWIVAGILVAGIVCGVRWHRKTTIQNINQSSISSGVVPHHLLAKEIIDKFYKHISLKENPETIILLSPDHFRSGFIKEGGSFITLEIEAKKFKELKVNTMLLRKLAGENKMVFNNSFITFEYGVMVQLPYIRQYFPDTKILPILIPFNTTKEQFKHLIEVIHFHAPFNAVIISSVDFSHYLPREVAEFHDVKSINTLITNNENDFEDLEVDCWQCLYGARLFAQLRNKEFPEIIAHKNSADYSHANRQEETTSYFSFIFKEGNYQEREESKGKTILFVGDIMLDRGVENLMKKNSSFYPFQKITQFLKGVDIVFGNLEGPIVKVPKKISGKDLKFAFSPDTINGLFYGKINLVSLANNHTLDMGKSGLEETKELLEQKNINFVGDPVKCSKEFLFKKDGIMFFAFNKTFPFNCKDEEIFENVKSVRMQNKRDFLILSLHWGGEYLQKSLNIQRKFAHKIIDAGADLIVGYHPHVVQDIEIYNGRLIFYSLGNFIFDQYFPKETRESLAVGLEIYPSKLVYRIFPIVSSQSQPFLMKQVEKKEFLERLASKSDPVLSEQIMGGIIRTERFKN